MPGPRGDLVHDVDALAAGLGLAAGQRATDAMAAHGDLRVAYADPAFEARALARLAAWSRRWSPLTRPDGVDGIALDVTGCTHLFGGEAALLDAMRARLTAMGLTAHLACAPNHAAAHALARHAAAERPVTMGEAGLAAGLAPLPVAALRVDPASVTLLRRLGLKTIGQVERVPRAALKKRFGANRRRRDPRDDTHDDYLGRSLGTSADVLARLDEAHGRLDIPLDPDRPVAPPRVVRGLAEPILEVAAVLACARPMIERLMAMLEARGQGARRLRLEAFRTDGGRASTVLALSRATRDAGHVVRLLVDRLDDWRAEFGFDALAVEALDVAPMAPVQDDGLEGARRTDPHALIDRLRTRLGKGAVLRAELRESHVPERAEAWLEIGGRPGGRSQREPERRRGGPPCQPTRRRAPSVCSTRPRRWACSTPCPRGRRRASPGAM